jgi:peptidoglycan-associated lipoprotein
MASRPVRRIVIMSVSTAVALVLVGCGSRHKVRGAQDADVARQGRETAAETKGVPPSIGSDTSYELSDIHFNFDSAQLRSGDRETLTRHGQWLAQNQSARVLIEGHCDERGTIEYNLALGERRADAARGFLENYGISSARLETVSYGKERPITPGHDESAWALNRRAHFVKR